MDPELERFGFELAIIANPDRRMDEATRPGPRNSGKHQQDGIPVGAQEVLPRLTQRHASRNHRGVPRSAKTLYKHASSAWGTSIFDMRR